MEKFLEGEKKVKQLLHLIGRCHIGRILRKLSYFKMSASVRLLLVSQYEVTGF